MDKKEFISTVIKDNGAKFQKKKAIEELSELSVELIRDLEGNGDRRKIIEELADVSLILDELKVIYDITDLCVEGVVQYKIDKYIASILAKKSITHQDAEEANSQGIITNTMPWVFPSDKKFTYDPLHPKNRPGVFYK